MDENKDSEEHKKRATYQYVRKRVRSLQNISKFGLNNSKVDRRANKKSVKKQLYVVLSVDRRGDVLHVPGIIDEGEASQREQSPPETG